MISNIVHNKKPEFMDVEYKSRGRIIVYLFLLNMTIGD